MTPPLYTVNTIICIRGKDTRSMAARMSVKKPNRLEFAVRDCSIHSVVVYKDRAEVKRIIRAELLEGTNEVVISGLAETINRNSIRYVTLQTIPFLCDFSSIPDDAGLMHRTMRHIGTHSRRTHACYQRCHTHVRNYPSVETSIQIVPRFILFLGSLV